MPNPCPKCRFDNPEGTLYCGKCGTRFSGSNEVPPAFTETLETPRERLGTGSLFAGRYQIIEELGHGGMGRVYRALDRKLNEEVALKVIKPEIALNKTTLERFQNEIRLARKIGHRHVGRMFELMEEKGTHFITMEYVSGQDLKGLIRQSKQLAPGTAVAIAKQVGEGLEEAHRLGIIHRDLKPSNIIIDREGNARIMDFGIARSIKTRGMTDAGVMVGTPEYMSPEQVEAKDVDHRSDIYALGIILYEMLTGRTPFEGDTPLSVAVKQKAETPPDPRAINPLISDDLRRVILKCLEKPKERRYQSASELLRDLSKVAESVPAAAAQAPTIRRPATSKQITVRLPSKKFWIPAAAMAIAALAYIVWQFIPQKESAKRSIAVLGFKNQTGDTNFDYLQETIPNLLITSLEQSGHFRVTSWQRLRDLLRLSGKEGTAFLDEEAGFEVCRKEGIEALVIGFFTKAGETFVTDIKVLDAVTKQSLKASQARGEGAASILKTQIDAISRDVSRGIGLPAFKIETSRHRVIDLTTDSLEAYKYFLKGRDEYEKFYYAEARKSLEKAVSLDPTFAVAHHYLALAAGDLADFNARDGALEKARQYAAKATEKERLSIEAAYAKWVEINEKKQLSLLKEYAEKYPQEKYAHFELAQFYYFQERIAESASEMEKALALDPEFGLALNAVAYAHARLGKFDQAIKEYERYAALFPGEPNPLDSIAALHMRQGKLDESAAKYREALALKPDFYLSCLGLAYVYALKEDYPEVNRWLEEFISRAPTVSAKYEGSSLQAFFNYFQGRWDASLAALADIKKAAEKYGVEYALMALNFISGYIHSDRGEFDLAGRAFQAFADYLDRVGAAAKPWPAVVRGLILIGVDFRQGRTREAKRRIDEVRTLLPELNPDDRKFSTMFVELASAEIALAENSVEAAIAIAEKVVFPDIISMRPTEIATYNLPFLKDVLARAYWKKGDLDKAAAEYRRLMTIDPASQVRFLIHPLYHYRLGLVLEEKGSRDEAAAEYKKFLDYWKDADETIPEKGDARNRSARLK